MVELDPSSLDGRMVGLEVSDIAVIDRAPFPVRLLVDFLDRVEGLTVALLTSAKHERCRRHQLPPTEPSDFFEPLTLLTPDRTMRVVTAANTMLTATSNLIMPMIWATSADTPVS